MQKMLRKHFSNSTVITIAHRLATIMDSDQILVLDNGCIAEIGPPQQLLLKPMESGMLSQIICAYGEKYANTLRAMANAKAQGLTDADAIASMIVSSSAE
jgi:ABC-type protease/lipase transport system fused ATPase/permease subunit